jgi:hypothetical protein
MTGTYNPIVEKKDIPRLSLFQQRPTPEPGIALVLFQEGKPLVTLWPEDRLTAGEVKWGKFKTIYKVDISEHQFSFKCTLPCQGDAFNFHAEVQATSSVDNPSIIVERNTTDVLGVLEPLITQIMRNITRKYDVEKSAAAEQAITKAIQEETYDVGLKLDRISVKLSLEEDARAHLRKLKQIERDKERERKEAELDRLRDDLELDRMKTKLAFYTPLIQGGHWQLLALQLTNHPDDVVIVAQTLSQQRQSEMENQLIALKIMLEEDALEPFHIEDAGKRVLQRFIEHISPNLEGRAFEAPKEKKEAPKAKDDETDKERESDQAQNDDKPEE